MPALVFMRQDSYAKPPLDALIFLPVGVLGQASEAMWKRAAYLLQPPILSNLGLDATPFGAASTPSPLMVGYAGLYVIVGLVVATRLFASRDL